jgi:hypothetical protein
LIRKSKREETKAGEACLIPIVKKVVDFMADKNKWQSLEFLIYFMLTKNRKNSFNTEHSLVS